jgi:hypothetical protein
MDLDQHSSDRQSTGHDDACSSEGDMNHHHQSDQLAGTQSVAMLSERDIIDFQPQESQELVATQESQEIVATQEDEHQDNMDSVQQSQPATKRGKRAKRKAVSLPTQPKAPSHSRITRSNSAPVLANVPAADVSGSATGVACTQQNIKVKCSACQKASQQQSTDLPDYEEDELYHHFMNEHCFDGVSVFNDETTIEMGFDVCKVCCFVAKRGLLSKHKCRIPRSRADMTKAWIRDIHSFRSGFLGFDFSKLEIGLHMPPLATLFNSRAPTLNYMPGNSELQANLRLIFIAVVKRLRQAPLDTQLPIWTLFLSLPRLLLSLPGGDDQDSKGTTSSIVTERVRKFMNGSFEELRAEHQELAKDLHNKRAQTVPLRLTPDAIAHSVVTTIRTSGSISKASHRLLSGMALADAKDPEVESAVGALLGSDRPVFQPKTASIPLGSACPIIAEADVLNAVNSLQRSSASGITGWHAAHLKSIASTLDGLRALTFVVNAIYHDKLPEIIREGLHTSILVPLTKPKGGVRPILINDVLVRLVEKCVVNLEQTLIARRMEPIQLAVGTKGGMEAIIHGIRSHIYCHPDHVTVAVDFKNAFGSISRDAVAAALDTYKYEDTKHTRWLFNNIATRPSRVLTSPSRFMQYQAGVPQGSPTSMQWFCLGLQPLLIQADKRLSKQDGFVVAYADDVFLTGPYEVVAQAFEDMKLNASQYGLKVEERKCQLLQLAPQGRSLFPFPPMQSIEVLGTPVGDSGVESEEALIICNHEPFERLRWIKDLQCRLLLLRQSLSTKHQHLSRTMPPSTVGNCLKYLDELTSIALSEII